MAFDGSLIISKEAGLIALGANHTVNFTSGMTAAAMQAEIDVCPKNLGANTLTFQFGDGTYNTTMTSAIEFNRFSNGTLIVQGDASESGLHTDQEVTLDFSAGTSNGLVFSHCDCRIVVKNLHVKKASTAINTMHFEHCTKYVIVSGCYTEQDATTEGQGIYFDQCLLVYASYHYVDGHYKGISCTRSSVNLNTIASTGVQCVYGLESTGNANIGTNDDTTPGGSTSATLISGAGVIHE